MKFLDSSTKTNWKFIAIVVVLGFLVIGVSIVTLRPKVEQRGKVEQVVYTKASWTKSFGAPSLNLFVANIDGSARRVLKEELPFDAKFFLLPEQKEVLYIFQEMYFPYTIHIKRINLETKKETTLATYKSQKGEGRKLYIPLLSPDKNKLALTIGKNLFIHDIRVEQLLEPRPLYTHTEASPYSTLSPEFWDSLGNIYLKSSTDGYIKINSKGEKLPLPEELNFLQISRSGSRVSDLHFYTSPDGNFIAWEETQTLSHGDPFGTKLRLYAVKQDRAFTLNNPHSPVLSDVHTITVNDGGDNSIANDILLIDNVAIDSIQGISKEIALSYGDSYKKSFEVLGFARAVPLTGGEKSSQEKEIEKQKSEFETFKKLALYPTYLPSGWIQKSEKGGDGGLAIDFQNESGGLFFIQEQKSNLQVPKGYIQIRDYLSQYPEDLITSKEYGVLNGNQGLYFTVGKSKQLLIWSKGDMDIAIVCFDYEGCSLGKEELIRIAESMKKQTQIQSTIDTSTWKTYRNSEFGFEVRYPKDWYASLRNGSVLEISNEQRSKVGTGSENNVLFQMIVSKDQKLLDLFDAFKTMKVGIPYEKDLEIYTKLEDFKIGGIPAVRYRADRSQIPYIGLPIEEEVLFRKGEYIFEVRFSGFTDSVLNQHKELMNQILSTFRFVE